MARILFRQGIVNHGQTPGQTFFLQQNGSDVDLFVSPQQTIVAFADGTKDYLFTEANTILNAWVNVTGPSNNWLYWDINKITGVRTFGNTTIPPIIQPTIPSVPIVGQMWFDTSTGNLTSGQMHEYNGSVFVPVLRVFAAIYNGTTFVSPVDGVSVELNFTGSQVMLTGIARNTGSLAFDSNGMPIINQNGKFFTTEDLFTTGIPDASGLKINNIVRSAKADEPIGAFQSVVFTDFNQIGLASPFDFLDKVYGIVEQPVPTNGIANVVTEGIIFNELWDFSDTIGNPNLSGPTNTPIYINATGELTTNIALSIPNAVVMGAIIGQRSIIFSPGLYGSTGITATAGDHGTLTGLLDDDHPLYINDARGDLRYYQQAVADNIFITRTGDTMSGSLLLDADPVLNLEAATKQYVDGLTSGGLANIVEDITPQLGGTLDVNGNNIVSIADANINIVPDGTGNILLGTMLLDSDQVIGAGQDNFVLTYDNVDGLISLEALPTSGLANIVEDITPQLGGTLDVNGNNIVSIADANINIVPDGTGNVVLGNLVIDSDQVLGAGVDGYALSYNDTSGLIELTPSVQSLEINNQASSYTIQSTDAGDYIIITNGADNILTIPDDVVPLDIGTEIRVQQGGAGTTTIEGAAGVSLTSLNNNVAIEGQNGVVTMIKTAANTWELYGDLAATVIVLTCGNTGVWSAIAGPLSFLGSAAQAGRFNAFDMTTPNNTSDTYSIVGAPNDGTQGPFTHGSARIFHYEVATTTWTEQQILYSGGLGFPAGSGFYGAGVSIDNARAAVGDNTTATSVDIWDRVGSTWTLNDTLTAANKAGGDFSGAKVALVGDLVAVSSRERDAGGQFNAGVVTTWTRALGVWTEDAAEIVAQNLSVDISLGLELKITPNGQWLIVASINEVEIHERVAGAWVFNSLFTIPGPGVFADIPVIGVNNDRFAIGKNEDNATNVDVYSRSGTVWTLEQSITPPVGSAGFGSAIALHSGLEQLAISAVDTTTGLVGAGRVYIYNLVVGVWTEVQQLESLTPVVNGEFGIGLGYACDQLGTIARRATSGGPDAEFFNDV